MTEPRPEIDDELVSAVLDGEATAEERALVEASPDGRRRLEELRAVAARVAEAVTPLSPAIVDRLVATALDAESAPVPAAPVSSLDMARSRRKRSWGQIVAAAAAAVVLLFGVIAGVRALSSGSSSSDSASSATADTAGAADGSKAATGGLPEPSTPSGPEAATANDRAGIVPLSLGAQPDADAVADAVADALATRLDAADQVFEQQFGYDAIPTPGVCPGVTSVGGPWTVVAVTTLPGGAATVVAEGVDPATARLVVVDDATCEVLRDRPG